MNLEYLLVDSRTFSTNEEGALKTFFGASVDSSTSYRMEIEVREGGGGGRGAGTGGQARWLSGLGGQVSGALPCMQIILHCCLPARPPAR